jgi:two-component system OmpR family response regulator
MIRRLWAERIVTPGVGGIHEPLPARVMKASPHLLVVDDDGEIRSSLAHLFVQHGFRVSVAENGGGLWRILDSEDIDLVVLDGVLPGEDGLSLCRRMRAESSAAIIMLTAGSEEVDRAVGLETGADDCLDKPFSPRELVARVKAVLRRNLAVPGPLPSGVVGFEGWRLDKIVRQLRAPDEKLVRLSDDAFDLLVVFAENAQRILSRDKLLDLTRGRAAAPFERSIDVKVGRLRRRIESDPKDPTLIKTVRGRGYLFAPSVFRL